jgi:ABC-type branched-subunit amino acid transport system substrate-binding protein
MKGGIMKLLLAAVTAAAALAGPAASSADGLSAGQVVVPRGQAVWVAFADDLTGSASGFGQSLANAVQMAVESHPAIRGFPLQVELVDAPCGDPASDAAAAASIVADTRNVAVLGHVCSTGDAVALPIYQSAGVVTISGSTTNPALPAFGPDVFNSVAVPDGCCPFVDQFDPWYTAVTSLPSDLVWQQAYTLEFGTAPAPFADLYYDAAGLLIRDLQTTSSMDGGGNLVIDRAALAEAVRGTTRYQGVTCTVTLDPTTGYRIDDPAAVPRCAGGD